MEILYLLRINPFSKPLRTPSLVGTVMRSTEISSIHRTKREEKFVDLMIYPDVNQYTTVDYDSYASIARSPLHALDSIAVAMRLLLAIQCSLAHFGWQEIDHDVRHRLSRPIVAPVVKLFFADPLPIGLTVAESRS